jgi:hypothetical protein
MTVRGKRICSNRGVSGLKRAAAKPRCRTEFHLPAGFRLSPAQLIAPVQAFQAASGL